MNDTPSIACDEVAKGDTWDGITWEIEHVDDDDTEYSGTLTQAIFQIQDEAGTPVMTLDSDDVGDALTLNDTTPDQWSVTVEPRVMTLAAGNYSWALRLFDNSASPERRKVAAVGTVRVKPDPAVVA